MSLGDLESALPATYEVVREAGGVLAVLRSKRAALLAAGFAPTSGEGVPSRDLAGRAVLGEIDAGGERWVVRRFHHGGLVRWLGERCFLDPGRPFEELVLADRLLRAGLPTAEVIAARARRSFPLGWKLTLVTRRLEGTGDAAETLERMRRGQLGARERARFLACVGDLVGRAHALGLAHADLTPRNVLLSHADPARAWILDLDRARLAPPLSDRARQENLRRLYRAVRRRESRGAAFLNRSDYLRFLASYAAARGAKTRGREADWRSDWRAVVSRDRRADPLHRLGWFVEELFGRGPETRDGRAVVRG